ncbi:tetratricopeptide repeat protein [Aeromonas caviae]|uniref:tetratricopeptide repeat protein n=1 Tax=Aeromonas caviae TaxID=648 RepID=UPI003754299F
MKAKILAVSALALMTLVGCSHYPVASNAGSSVIYQHSEARDWYEYAMPVVQQAAEQGDVAAQINMGLRYEYGVKVPNDNVQAEMWYLRAAESGDAEAQWQLSCFYGNYHILIGGVDLTDEKKSLFWLRRAAENGNADAQSQLASDYAVGRRGLSQDNQQVVIWYRKAAEQGDASSQYHLGRRYAEGDIVKQDLKQAYAWFSAAAINSNARDTDYISVSAGYAKKYAEWRDLVAKKLTPIELADAQTLADLYLQQYQPKS